MDTEVIKAESQAVNAKVVARGVDVLNRGGLVAFRTETVYGVGARAEDADAVERLREVKIRPRDKAFTVHVGSLDEVVEFVPGLSGLASRLMRRAWPGPLTILLPVDDSDSAQTGATVSDVGRRAMYYDGKIGLRCPDDRTTCAILSGAKGPIVAASANQAGKPAPDTAAGVLEQLGGRIDLLIDAGPTRYAKPSTIVEITDSGYKMIRSGVLDAGIVDRLSVLRILLVCTGNTCRSPMAAGITRKILSDRLGCSVSELAKAGVIVTSAGTGGGGGGCASAHAVAVMARRGIDLSDHASTTVGPEMVHDSDHVYAMTVSHRDALLRMAPSVEGRIKLVAGEDVHDPIGGTEDDYERCAVVIEEGLRVRLQEVNL